MCAVYVLDYDPLAMIIIVIMQRDYMLCIARSFSLSVYFANNEP